MKKITLTEHEDIIAAVPKYCSGPGWGNTPIYVHIIDYSTNKYRYECFQPEEQSPEMQLLFGICAISYSQMRDAVMARTKVKRTNNTKTEE